MGARNFPLNFLSSRQLSRQLIYTVSRRFRGRFGRPFRLRGHDRPWKQPVHQIGEPSAGSLAVSGTGHVWQVLRNEQRPSQRQEAQKKADRVHPCPTRLPGAKVSLPEIFERGGSKRRGRRFVPLRDPSQNVVPEQKVNLREYPSRLNNSSRQTK